MVFLVNRIAHSTEISPKTKQNKNLTVHILHKSIYMKLALKIVVYMFTSLAKEVTFSASLVLRLCHYPYSQ